MAIKRNGSAQMRNYIYRLINQPITDRNSEAQNRIGIIRSAVYHRSTDKDRLQ